MSTEDIPAFIRRYGSDGQSRIRFAWNGQHGADFADLNDSFRQQVIAAVVYEPGKAGLDLVADLFEAEARWSREAWCVRSSFSKLGSILLTRGGTTQLDRFLEWFSTGFDSYSECHAMSLDPVTLAPLISEVERRLAGAGDPKQRALLELALQLFEKHKSGDPLRGMVKLHPGDLGRARRVGPLRALLLKIKLLFRRR